MAKTYSLVFIFIVLLALWFWGSTILQEFFDEAMVVFRKYGQDNYFLSIGLFVVVSVVSAMFLAFSSIWLIPIAIPLWGNALTVLLLLFGWLVGGILSYFIGRVGVASVLEYFVSEEKLNSYTSVIRGRSFAVVLLSRLVLPAEIPGYALGAVRYPFGKYVLITMLAEIPYALMAVYSIEAILRRDPWIFGGWIIVWLLSVSILMGILRKSAQKKIMNTGSIIAVKKGRELLL
jgi:uncharacterized membrane protein YdjX (TVP38/TMEM64 family)